MLTTARASAGLFGGQHAGLPSPRFTAAGAVVSSRKQQLRGLIRQAQAWEQDAQGWQRDERHAMLAGLVAAKNRIAVEMAPRAVCCLVRMGGSGIAIANGNLLLTARHVVSKLLTGQWAFAKFAGTEAIQAHLLAVDAKSDLAIMKLQTPAPGSLDIASPDLRPSGCFVLGSPDFAKPEMKPAAVCGAAPGKIWADAPLRPGFSGGGLLDGATAALCGIVSCFRNDHGGIVEFADAAAIGELVEPYALSHRGISRQAA